MLRVVGARGEPEFLLEITWEAAAEGEEPGAGSGRPLDGYIATAAMAFLALFIIAKSARR